jgi:hypothetical protein
LTSLEELARLLSEKSRRIFVAENPIDLRVSDGGNCVYVLQLPENVAGAAGGRIGGIGERRIVKLYCYRQGDGNWIKVYETDDDEILGQLELPYSAAGLTAILPDGSEKVVTGLVDQQLVQSYNQTIKATNSKTSVE